MIKEQDREQRDDEEAAFSAFYTRAFPHLRDHARRHLREVTDGTAEEVVQAVFVSLWEQRVMFLALAPKAQSSYAYRAVTNRCLDVLRHHSRPLVGSVISLDAIQRGMHAPQPEHTHRSQGQTPADYDPALIARAASQPEQVALEQELWSEVRAAASGHERLLALSVAGFSGEEMARQMTAPSQRAAGKVVSTVAVKMRLVRVRKRVRARLVAHSPERFAHLAGGKGRASSTTPRLKPGACNWGGSPRRFQEVLSWPVRSGSRTSLPGSHREAG